MHRRWNSKPMTWSLWRAVRLSNIKTSTNSRATPFTTPPANPSARSPTTPVPRTGKEATALSHSANCQMLSVCAGACFTDAKSQTSLPLATGSYVLTGFLQGLSAAAQAPGPGSFAHASKSLRLSSSALRLRPENVCRHMLTSCV